MSVHISKRGDRVTLRSSWRPGIETQCKKVPGWSWSSTRSEWSYPLSMNTLRKLRKVFGDSLVVSDELMAWARRERRRERRLTDLGRRYDATLVRVPTVAPAMATAMSERTYQRSGARFGAVAGSWLCADEPGLGKTITTLGALIEGNRWRGDILVAAPKVSLKSVWHRQVQMWTGADVVYMPDGKAARRKAWESFLQLESEPRILVVNPEMLRRQYKHYCKKCDKWDIGDKFPLEHHLEDHRTKRAIYSEDWPEILNHEWTAVLVDESHDAFAAYTPANITQVVQGLLDIKSEVRIAMTGTPLRGQEKRIWGTLDWLGVKTGGYWGFIDSYFEVANNGFGKVVHGIDPSKRDEFHKLVDRMVLRRTRPEVRPDLPMGQRMDVLLPMTPKQQQQYTQFQDEGEVALQSGIIAGLGTLSELTRLKQMAYGVWNDPEGNGKLVATKDSPKLEWIFEFLKQRGITGKAVRDWLPEVGVGYKYVIASQFTEVLDGIEFELNRAGIKTLKITGDVTGKKRDRAQELFQSNDIEYRVLLIQTQTGGVSIELDAWCDEMIIVDETWIADDQVQLEGRINNRSGRVAPRTWWYLRTEGTIDQSVADDNWRQHDLEHQLLDGRRGVELALHLLRGGDPAWESSSQRSSRSHPRPSRQDGSSEGVDVRSKSASKSRSSSLENEHRERSNLSRKKRRRTSRRGMEG